ncbi:hypothetical protein ACVJMZ_003031 [Sinorhizobium medicae]
MVDYDILVVRKITNEPHDLADQFFRGMAGKNEVAYPDGTGINERVARLATLMLELDNRIEGRARWLATHPAPDVLAVLAQRQREREHLGDALDGERHLSVAGTIKLPAGRDDCHAEVARIDSCKLRNIVRDPAFAEARRQFPIDVVDDRLKAFLLF